MRLIWRLEILEFEEREHRSNSRRCHARTPSLSLLWPAGMARLRPTTLLCNIHNVRTIIAWRWSTGALDGRISVGRSNLVPLRICGPRSVTALVPAASTHPSAEPLPAKEVVE